MKTRYMTYEAAEKDCPANGHIHALPGINRLEDYYVIGTDKPYKRLIPQTISIKHSKFWNACHFIWRDDCVLYASAHRVQRIITMIKSGELTEIDSETRQYLQGHRTPSEYWHKKTNKYMEAARISHAICDLEGKQGHESRQQIRREIRNKSAAL
jgi:hypothetical protein